MSEAYRNGKKIQRNGGNAKLQNLSISPYFRVEAERKAQRLGPMVAKWVSLMLISSRMGRRLPDEGQQSYVAGKGRSLIGQLNGDSSTVIRSGTTFGYP